MYITNNDGLFVKATKKVKGGYVLSTVKDKESATDFVTNEIFDVLERLNSADSEKGWKAE